MATDPSATVTQLMTDDRLGDAERAHRLLPLVYEQLRAIARQRVAAERADHTLQATELVHEAYLRLIGDRRIPWRNRAHFFSAAADAMRNILIDHARERGAAKRGGQVRRRVPLNVVQLADEANPNEILAVDEAVSRLERQDPELGRIARLRFYAGLSETETAELLGVSERTLRRSWSLAKAWLRRELD